MNKGKIKGERGTESKNTMLSSGSCCCKFIPLLLRGFSSPVLQGASETHQVPSMHPCCLFPPFRLPPPPPQWTLILCLPSAHVSWHMPAVGAQRGSEWPLPQTSLWHHARFWAANKQDRDTGQLCVCLPECTSHCIGFYCSLGPVHLFV